MEHDSNETMRLSKRMAQLGLCSRREADSYIEQGWVKVNGQTAVLGQKVTERRAGGKRLQIRRRADYRRQPLGRRRQPHSVQRKTKIRLGARRTAGH